VGIAAKRYDEAADALAKAHLAHHALLVEQSSLLTQAGTTAPGGQWTWISRYPAAFVYALLRADPASGSGIAAIYTSESRAQPKPLANHNTTKE
jgi:hypothetical protein